MTPAQFEQFLEKLDILNANVERLCHCLDVANALTKDRQYHATGAKLQEEEFLPGGDK